MTLSLFFYFQALSVDNQLLLERLRKQSQIYSEKSKKVSKATRKPAVTYTKVLPSDIEDLESQFATNSPKNTKKTIKTKKRATLIDRLRAKKRRNNKVNY